MSKSVLISAAVLLASATLYAQEAVMPPPPVLVIEREFVKPGKTGAHDKSELAFARAMSAAKFQTHYVTAESVSGQSRALFMLGFPSFAQWEKENQAFEKTMASSVDHLIASDGDLLTEFSESVFVYDKEHSLGSPEAVHAHYFEITQFHVKPGHRAEFLELAAMYRDGHKKAGTDAHWALYESYYGEKNGGYYIAISPMKTLAEDDQGMNDGKKLTAALGEGGMKKLAEMTANCLEAEETNLFEINPKISYPADEWIKADPFWKPAPVAAAAAPAKKP